MASAGDVVVAAQKPVEVEQQPAEAHDDRGESGLPATTTATEEERRPVLQERRRQDNADQHEAVAPAASKQASASASEERPLRPEQQKAAPTIATKEEVEPPPQVAAAAAAADDDQAESTRERLKRHRREMAGRVWVPELWGQEKLLKDWVDCAVFDRPMVPSGLLTARRALIAECCVTRRTDRTTSPASSAGSSPPLRVRNGCS
ncbi:unnamed protein product [Urochloa decumbens]|uniref:Uncharacterized protein n=1 Tax=Urochloa decumbens TaxID=240449 RepID=A0ABC9F1X6_9POAL